MVPAVMVTVNEAPVDGHHTNQICESRGLEEHSKRIRIV
jgi:hypothetical protein